MLAVPVTPMASFDPDVEVVHCERQVAHHLRLDHQASGERFAVSGFKFGLPPVRVSSCRPGSPDLLVTPNFVHCATP